MTPAKSPRKRKKSQWLFLIGQAASFLCLIHCLATVALTFVAPSLLKLLPHNYWIESSAWAFVIFSALFLLSRAPKKNWQLPVLILIFSWGTTALILHNHNLFAAAFMSLALFQLYLTLVHHFHGHAEDDCCQPHPHAHPHPHSHHKDGHRHHKS